AVYACGRGYASPAGRATPVTLGKGGRVRAPRRRDCRWRAAGIPCRCIGPIHRREAVGVLELAILGLLHESAMHGYELRKQLTAKLGAIRAAISYGSLYPTLRRLQAGGWITEESPAAAPAQTGRPPLTSRRR